MIPVIIRPKLLCLKNRWRVNSHSKSQYTRDLIICLFSFSVMYGLYRGTLETLAKLHSSAALAYLPPSLPLGLVLMMLLSMLLFSNSVSALGSLFLSHDLDLILAAPISTYSFFRAKLLEVFFSSSWMAIVFGGPVIIGFGVSYHAGPWYYLIAILTLLPYFILASSSAMLAVTLFARVVPANRTREILLAVCAVALLGVYLIAKILLETQTSGQSTRDVLRMVNLLSAPNRPWIPSYWVALCLGEALSPQKISLIPYLGLLYTVSAAILSLTFLSISFFHYAGYSRARSNRNGLQIDSRRAQARLSLFSPFVSSPYRAIIAKEYKVFARDMSQAVQLLLLLGLCMIYLYNFRILSAVEGLPESTRVWWQGFLVISNLCMGAFVVTAVGTRFVFPSVSIEGQAYWILQSSPLPIIEVLRAKFWAWLIPVACIASVIFASGAFAINAEPHMVIINALSSWLVCYGIIGMAVGLGAFFANFNWEHTSQLAASFGSLVYMLTSTVLIGLNMLPASMLILMRTLKNFNYKFSSLDWYLGIGSCALLLMYVNYIATRWALRLGAQALESRRQ